MKQIFTQRSWLKYTTVMLYLRESVEKTLCMFASAQPDPSESDAYVSDVLKENF